MRRRRTRRSAMHRTELPEISLTPLIDTALTLLIIFMVTTPMINNSIKIDLPQGKLQEVQGQQQQELVVSLAKDGTMFFNNIPVTIDNLAETIRYHLVQTSQGQMRRVWLKIDKEKSVDTLVGVMDKIKFVEGVKDVVVATSRSA